MAIILTKNTPFTVGCAIFIVVTVGMAYLWFLNHMNKKALVVFSVPRDVKIIYNGKPLKSARILQSNKKRNKNDSITYTVRLPLGKHVVKWNKAGDKPNTVNIVITNTDKMKFFIWVNGNLQEAIQR